jgi:3-dehydroquinate dehydratase-2
MSRIVYLLNGPNLNLLGKREPHLYGHDSLADVQQRCAAQAAQLKLSLEFRQSNAEAALIDWIHEARERAGGLIINPGAYGHTSIALRDALAACACPILEVHISNVYQREAFRHHSYVSAVAAGVIVGCGTQGYVLALQRIGQLLDTPA